MNKKTASLGCSRIERLYDDSFYKWKLIPLHLINTTITPAFKSHPTLALSSQLNQFHKFYRNIFQFQFSLLLQFRLQYYPNFYGLIEILR